MSPACTSAPTSGVTLEDGRVVPCKYCVLAMGHSARDMYQFLYDTAGDDVVEAKSFAVGVRVEHPQEV